MNSPYKWRASVYLFIIFSRYFCCHYRCCCRFNGLNTGVFDDCCYRLTLIIVIRNVEARCVRVDVGPTLVHCVRIRTINMNKWIDTERIVMIAYAFLSPKNIKFNFKVQIWIWNCAMFACSMFASSRTRIRHCLQSLFALKHLMFTIFLITLGIRHSVSNGSRTYPSDESRKTFRFRLSLTCTRWWIIIYANFTLISRTRITFHCVNREISLYTHHRSHIVWRQMTFLISLAVSVYSVFWPHSR